MTSLYPEECNVLVLEDTKTEDLEQVELQNFHLFITIRSNSLCPIILLNKGVLFKPKHEDAQFCFLGVLISESPHVM
jgi:hypothetical protein